MLVSDTPQRVAGGFLPNESQTLLPSPLIELMNGSTSFINEFSIYSKQL